MTEVEGLRADLSNVRHDVQELIKEVAEVSADVKSTQKTVEKLEKSIEKLENSVASTPPQAATVVNMPGNKAPVVGWTMVAMATLELLRQYLPEIVGALRATH